MNLRDTWRQDASRIPGARLSPASDYSKSVELDRVYALMGLYYGEPWRRYHTINHIVSFRNALDEMELCPLPVKIACYFHDIIWLPGYDKSEERSADIATKWLKSLGTDPDFVDEVGTLILATKHDGLCPKSMAEAFMRDADLWTLGDDDIARFNETQALVRHEFEGVPESVYQPTRLRLFQKMFKTAIYWSGPGKRREAQAKTNLKTVGIFV